MKVPHHLYENTIKTLIFFNLYLFFNKLYFKIQPYFPWNIRLHLKNTNFYRQFIKKGDLCFDIGANIGIYTRNLLYCGAKVVSVEPQNDCLEKLYLYFNRNKKVKIVGKAIGQEPCYATIHICDEANVMSTLSEKWINQSRFSNRYKWTQSQKVKVITLDQLITIFGRPKFCKIDVEGYELEVLKGLHQKIKYLSLEFTRELFEDAKKCVYHLLTLGEVRFNFVIADGTNFYLDRFVNPNILFKTIESVGNERLWGDIYAKFI